MYTRNITKKTVRFGATVKLSLGPGYVTREMGVYFIPPGAMMREPGKTRVSMSFWSGEFVGLRARTYKKNWLGAPLKTRSPMWYLMYRFLPRTRSVCVMRRR